MKSAILSVLRRCGKISYIIENMARKKKNLPALSSISIESVAAEGKSLARLKMRPDDETAIVTFIPFGAPGDVVDIQVTKKKHSYMEGRALRIVTPSPGSTS